ncbi:uncharacterized protein [Lepeophtheirus salmonis]|uniref:uncharacterized protein n=1 Tax=Lepeophtheirus salmonis TaxID=72036 RepID=UPI001AE5AFCF|nr:uncharacterized protein LOC121115887 [Lepeophtheirus salmonis]
MKAAIVLIISCFALSQARPGGYTAKGGVVDFLKELDYLDQAVAAGKFAWNKHIEEELIQEEAFRNERSNSPQVPSFFTSQQNFAKLAGGLTFGEDASGSVQQTRLSRNAQPSPSRNLYYSSVFEKHAGQ